MVYRKSLRAATAAVGVMVAAFGAVPADAASAEKLAIVDVRGLDLAATGALDWSDLFPVRADLGEHLLVETGRDADATAKALGVALLPLAELPSGTPIYRVSGPSAIERAMLPGIGRLLWTDGEQVLIAPAKEHDVWALAGRGVQLYKIPAFVAQPIRPAALEAMASFAAPEFAEIDDMVARVAGANVQTYVDELVAFGTRHSNLQGGTQAQAYLKAKFESFGYTQILEQPVPNIGADNVCATKPGLVTPDKVFVVGGHYDSTSTDINNAPGADDNASGTAGTLEAARVLAGFDFESTLVFCGYAGEELGLLGSAAHAQALANQGVNVAGMINLDMIGYLAAGDAVDIDVASNGASAALRGLVTDVVARYVPGTQEVNGTLPQGASSDHVAFQQRGFPGIMMFEDTGSYSPFIHTANDTSGTSFNNPALAEKIVRAATATLAAMAIPITGGTDPGPTPTPTPGDSGDPADGVETVHGTGCACDLSATAGGTTSVLAPALLAAIAMAMRRRRST